MQCVADVAGNDFLHVSDKAKYHLHSSGLRREPKPDQVLHSIREHLDKPYSNNGC